MGGGLMQLVAYGAQDIYLTGNPQITFSKLSTEDTDLSMEATAHHLMVHKLPDQRLPPHCHVMVILSTKCITHLIHQLRNNLGSK